MNYSKKLTIFVVVFLNSLAAGFVFVIPSFNNSVWILQNINSTLKQGIKDFRIFYINDASTDGTGSMAKSTLEKSGVGYECIQNKKNQGALSNYYRAIHTCKDDEIIVALDGDDWLKDEHVLTELNKVYQNKDVWLTYGQYELSGSGKVGHCKSYSQECIFQNLFREFPWYASHLRTFYAGLFKRIKLKDLLYKGKFFPMTWDVAFMVSMLEMAGERHAFIQKPLYVYNTQNQQSDFRKGIDEQLYYHFVISKRRKYERLNEDVFEKTHFNKGFSRIIFGEKSCKNSVKIMSSESCYLFPVHGGVRKLRTKEQYAKAAHNYHPYNLYYEKNQYFKENVEKALKEVGTEWVMLDCDGKEVEKESIDWVFSELQRTQCECALVTEGASMDDFCLVSPFFSTYETYAVGLKDIGSKKLFRYVKKVICKKNVLLDALQTMNYVVGVNALLVALEASAEEDDVALLFQF